MALDTRLAQTVAQVISNKIKSSTKNTKPEENWKIVVEEIFNAIKDHAELDVTVDPVTVSGSPTDPIFLNSVPTGGPVVGSASPPTNPIKGKGKVK